MPNVQRTLLQFLNVVNSCPVHTCCWTRPQILQPTGLRVGTVQLSVELTALSSRIGRAIATLLNFYVSHSSATTFLRSGDKNCIYFIDKSFLFPKVKELRTGKKWLTVDEVTTKVWHNAFWTQCILHDITNTMVTKHSTVCFGTSRFSNYWQTTFVTFCYDHDSVVLGEILQLAHKKFRHHKKQHMQLWFHVKYFKICVSNV